MAVNTQPSVKCRFLLAVILLFHILPYWWCRYWCLYCCYNWLWMLFHHHLTQFNCLFLFSFLSVFGESWSFLVICLQRFYWTIYMVVSCYYYYYYDILFFHKDEDVCVHALNIEHNTIGNLCLDYFSFIRSCFAVIYNSVRLTRNICIINATMPKRWTGTFFLLSLLLTINFKMVFWTIYHLKSLFWWMVI